MGVVAPPVAAGAARRPDSGCRVTWTRQQRHKSRTGVRLSERASSIPCGENETLRMPEYDALPRLCSEVKVCFPPAPSYCFFCRATNPNDCPHPELQHAGHG